MALRKTPLVTDHYYHAFNRSVGKMPIFKSDKCYIRMLELIKYYRHKNLSLAFSKFIKLSDKDKTEVLSKLDKDDLMVEIVSFCIMPNHFHFLLKQLCNNGIKNFLQQIQNSFAKYFNIKNSRNGSLWDNNFKAVLVEENDYLLHLSRYIHLNPYSSILVKRPEDVLNYQWSSITSYLGTADGISSPEIVTDQFKPGNGYKEFLLDQADYQKELGFIKYMTLDN